jgi:hypothetical protein
VDEGAGDWAAPVPREPSDRARALAPAVLLVVVALLGVRNHIVRDQSSWQGASFGMFATYDNRTSRTVIVEVDSGEGPERIDVPPDLEDDAERLKVVPTEGGAGAMAAAVLERIDDDHATVTVDVRRVVLDDRHGLEVRVEPIVEARASR